MGLSSKLEVVMRSTDPIYVYIRVCFLSVSAVAWNQACRSINFRNFAQILRVISFRFLGMQDVSSLRWRNYALR